MKEKVGGEGVPEGFLALPGLVYADDPLWIPEDPVAVECAFSSSNPWFARGGRAQAFCLPGRARVAAFLEAGRLIDGSPAAFFGYWESIGDAASDAALFARAEAWAREQGGLGLYGPINFTTYGSYRLRLEAEPGAVPFPGEPYNPVSYPQRLEALGFHLCETYLTQVSDAAGARVLCQGRRPALERLKAEGYCFQPLEPGTWLAHLPELHRLADGIFGGNFAYTPMSYAAFSESCGEAFIARCCPETSVIAYGPEGDIAGLFLVYPHYGPLVVQGQGARRVSVGALRFDQHWPELLEQGPPAAILKTVGVAPPHRRKGLMEALTVFVLDRGERRYAQWLGALIRQDNPSRRFGGDRVARERWYGLYVKRLG